MMLWGIGEKMGYDGDDAWDVGWGGLEWEDFKEGVAWDGDHDDDGVMMIDDDLEMVMIFGECAMVLLRE